MVKTLLISVLIIAIAMILLCVNIIFRKNGKFPSMHIHDSEEMKKKDIHCVLDQDKEARAKNRFY
jgi:hypothetical protein